MERIQKLNSFEVSMGQGRYAVAYGRLQWETEKKVAVVAVEEKAPVIIEEELDYSFNQAIKNKRAKKAKEKEFKAEHPIRNILKQIFKKAGR